MKTFIIELDDLEDSPKDAHVKLMEYVTQNRFEFWEYIKHQLVLVTPDTITAKVIMEKVKELYGYEALVVVFEVSIDDIAAYGPTDFMDFFEMINHPGFVPAWERGGDKPYDSSHIAKILRDIDIKKRFFPKE